MSFPASSKTDFYSEADKIIGLCSEDIETLYVKLGYKNEREQSRDEGTRSYRREQREEIKESVQKRLDFEDMTNSSGFNLSKETNLRTKTRNMNLFSP